VGFSLRESGRCPGRRPLRRCRQNLPMPLAPNS